MKTKQAVILAGGKGNRAKPFTSVRPKPLLKINSKTILEHNLNQLNGIVKEVILVIGYKGELIKDFIGDSYKDLKIKYVWQKKQLGTGDAVKKAIPELKDKFLLMYGDDLYNKTDILKCLKKFPCILLAQTSKPENFGQVSVEEKFIKELIEKPKKHLSCLVNCGLYFIDKSIFDFKIKKSSRGEYEFTDYIKNLIKKRKIFWVLAKKWVPFSLSSNLIKENNFLIKKSSVIYSNPIKGYVIGVDGGGTKTTAALADLEGRILKLAKTGPSSFVKVGIKETVLNITKAIEKILKGNKKNKILSTFIALAAIEEDKKMKKVVMRNLLRQPKISQIFKGKVKVSSDQIAGFRTGTDENDGVVLISGTGSASHGWYRNKEVHASGWGWLSDEGSAFWLGQKAYQAVLKDLDNRGPKTLMTDLFLRKFKVKKAEGLKRKIYFKNNLIKTASSLSLLVNKAAQKGDKIAKNILIESGKELAISANTVIKELNLQKRKFPLVLIGNVFKSKIILNTVQKEIKKTAPKIDFIKPRKDPVIGAVKLAIKEVKNS